VASYLQHLEDLERYLVENLAENCTFFGNQLAPSYGNISSHSISAVQLVLGASSIPIGKQ
jgi:hypothetical protein